MNLMDGWTDGSDGVKEDDCTLRCHRTTFIQLLSATMFRLSNSGREDMS
jgi:hypothetical protein